MNRSRRRFVKKAAGTALGLAAFPSIVPASVLGKNGQLAPSDRIVMAGIGLGNMGTSNTRDFLEKKEVQYVAVCDLDTNRLKAAQSLVNGKYKNSDCRGYGDFRELLEKEDLDACMIATPDHWHALLAIHVANKGIDIYGEKPFARSIKEGRAMVGAVKRNNLIWQTGSWQRSVPNFYRACQLVINGRIGKVDYIEVGLPDGGHNIGTPPVMEVPKELNWEMWLGPAPKVPYRGVSHWDWRWILDYSGGQMTDWAGHHIDIAHWGMGMDRMGPVSVQGEGVYPREGLYNAPVEYDFICTYANGVKIRVANASRLPNGMGTTWYGDKGNIYVSRGNTLRASDAKILEEKIGPEEIQLIQSEDHWQNFLDSVRSREETIAPAEYAHRSISVGLLGEVAMLTGQQLDWDPDKEVFTNSEMANRLLLKPFSAPWKHSMLS